MEEIKVSVVIPVYNAEKYLRETLESVLNQTFREIEVICVDDGSTDSSVSIIREYMEKDNRISLFFQEEESDNAAKARNMGLKAARGQYLLFLDADDVYEEKLIELAYRKAIETEADIVMFDVFIMDSALQMDIYVRFFMNPSMIEGRDYLIPKSENNLLFQIMGESVWNKLIKRELVVKNKIYFRALRQCDDFEFIALAAACANKIAFLNRRLIHYRKDVIGSQTSSYDVNCQAGYQASYYLKMELERRGLYSIYKRSYVNKAIEKIIFYMTHIKDLATLKNFYTLLKEQIDKLDIFSLEEADYHSKDNIEQVRWMKECDNLEEYFFRRTRAKNLYQIKNFRLPVGSKEKEIKIVLYGAGQEGKKIQNLLSFEPNIKIVGWLDREYEKYGFGVMPPEHIVDLEYDYIFIAIGSQKIIQQVKQYLLGQGCDEKKIVEMVT